MSHAGCVTQRRTIVVQVTDDGVLAVRRTQVCQVWTVNERWGPGVDATRPTQTGAGLWLLECVRLGKKRLHAQSSRPSEYCISI